ncbi:hypothetical protein SAMN05192533_101461 [Mesobacillus persicus]|uniref:Uncharacterized protein n=1 Tax=Mesobacillus persicus TaxID=930146 RepID=A0A1H7WLP1_9BACI|nr:hypothetical protein SAMN05192533_101461 [Mesobacillus persicus]
MKEKLFNNINVYIVGSFFEAYLFFKWIRVITVGSHISAKLSIALVVLKIACCLIIGLIRTAYYGGFFVWRLLGLVFLDEVILLIYFRRAMSKADIFWRIIMIPF